MRVVKVGHVRVKCGHPPPERSEIVPCHLIETFLVNPFPGMIALLTFGLANRMGFAVKAQGFNDSTSR